MEHQFVESNGIGIHTVTAGPPDGEPVLLIHGFPETWYEWRKTIPALEDRYRLIAPDTRGFGDSDKPDGPYDRAMLAADMVGVLDAFDIERAAVVGHDWGGIIGFKMAIDYPERTTKLALLDTLCTVWPPGARHGYWFKAEPRPEEFFANHHEQFIDQVFTGRSEPALQGWPEAPWPGPSSVARPSSHWATEADVAIYRAAFADPGSHRAAITYYRDALAFHLVEPDHTFEADEQYRALPSEDVAEMWEAGLDDHPLYAQYMDYGPEDRLKRYPHPALWMFADPKGSLKTGTIPVGNPFVDQFSTYFPDLRAEPVPGAGHFFVEEKPDFVNDRLRTFLDGTDR
ncbi:MAG: alpha/beta fold hydrolase [Acidimicrobiales bacterium]